MTANSEFSVQVVDDEIVVTLPGSHYSVTYYKSAKSPQLLAKYISDRDDPRVEMRVSEFLALAWRLADDKARELELGLGRVRRRLRSARSFRSAASLRSGDAIAAFALSLPSASRRGQSQIGLRSRFSFLISMKRGVVRAAMARARALRSLMRWHRPCST